MIVRSLIPLRLPSGFRAVCLLSLGLLAGLLATSGQAAGPLLDAAARADGRTQGYADAPILLVEYSDYTCGFCLKFHRETWPRLQAKYVDTGKVRFQYRDYPRAASGPGVAAALASRCAEEQGRFWPMHNRLFASGGRLGASDLQRYAEEVALDLARFSRCMEESRHVDAIFSEREEGRQFGFRGTPGFLLVRQRDGEAGTGQSGQEAIVIPGAFPYEVFEAQIERLLGDGPTKGKG
jgi:protein-disulfide isomerase